MAIFLNGTPHRGEMPILLSRLFGSGSRHWKIPPLSPLSPRWGRGGGGGENALERGIGSTPGVPANWGPRPDSSEERRDQGQSRRLSHGRRDHSDRRAMTSSVY